MLLISNSVAGVKSSFLLLIVPGDGFNKHLQKYSNVILLIQYHESPCVLITYEYKLVYAK